MAFRILSPAAISQMMQTQAAGASGLNNQFGLVDLPNQGPVSVGRVEGNASPTEGNFVYTVTLDNSALAVVAPSRVILGDYGDVYQLSGNTEVLDPAFTIAGTWGAQSASVFIARTLARPWSVKNIHFNANNEDFFAGNNISYFDTPPNGDSPTKRNLATADWLTPNQFNPAIQIYDRSTRFDGVNGLDITIPVGRRVTLQFSVAAEGSAGIQTLLK